jgi:hypothetical protein
MGDFFAEWYAPLTGGAILLVSVLGTYLLRMRRGKDPIKSTNILVFTLMYFVALTVPAFLTMTGSRYLILGTAIYVGLLLVYDAVLSIVRRHTR